LSELSGKEVIYTSAEVDQFEIAMKQRGLPEELIAKIIGFIVDIKNGQESVVTSDLESKLGRKPTQLKEGLKKLFGL
jgi:NAD(P)H dehydrogenase (quinone)